MNLISCDHCGVVLDRDKLPFPEDVYFRYGDDYMVDYNKAYWNGERFVPFVPCPVCHEKVGNE